MSSPTNAQSELDLRLVPGQDPENVIALMEDILERARTDTALEVTTEMEVLQKMPPVETHPEDSLVSATIDAAEAVRGTKPSVAGVSYGTDGAVLAPHLNASLVIFGPGLPQQAHQPNEYVDVSELSEAVDAYAHIARSLLS